MQRALASLLIAVCFGVSGCGPSILHSDPMTGWKGLGTFSYAVVPETIKQDSQGFFQTLPKVERNPSESDWAVTYWEDGIGQHAVVLQCPHDGESWYYALVYDRDNRRTKVLKYSTGSYMS